MAMYSLIWIYHHAEPPPLTNNKVQLPIAFTIKSPPPTTPPPPVPTLVVGLMITQDTPLERLESFAESWKQPCPGYILRGFFVLGAGSRVHSQFSTQSIVLDIPENINGGKTFHWIEKAITLFVFDDHPLNGIVKMDVDTSVNWVKFGTDVLPSLSPYYYAGRINTFEFCGGGSHCPPAGCLDFKSEECWIYMSGGWYALSLNLAKILIHECEYPRQHQDQWEDWQTGNWIRECFKAKVHVSGFANGDFFCHDGHTSNQDIRAMTWSKDGSCVK